MFDFEKLEVYKKAKTFNKCIHALMPDLKLDRSTQDQLKRASLSIMLNIAEGSGRFTKPDKRNFYVIARGSVFECVAILDFLKDLQLISDQTYQLHYSALEEISKMLYSLIKGLNSSN
jgi:four helix bundle protein